MVGAAPVCPPERPRSDVSMRKEHVPMRKGDVSICKRYIPPAKAAFLFINDACSHQNMFVHLPMDAPLQGDTVGHAGTDPTSLHQTPLPRNLPHLCLSANTSPATLGHGAT